MESNKKQCYSPVPKVNRSRISSFKSREVEAMYHSPQKAKTRKNGFNEFTTMISQLSLINTNKPERKDAFGTQIIKNSKIHKVSFIDQINPNKKLVDLLEILVGQDNILEPIKEETKIIFPIKICTYGLGKDERRKRTNEKEHTQCSSCLII